MSAPRVHARQSNREGRACPPPCIWMRAEAQLRPVAIARVAGITSSTLAGWARGDLHPAAADVPLLPALLALHARLVRGYPDPADRRRWWCTAWRTLGWISPAELLRRGRIGEVLLLPLASPSTPWQEGSDGPEA